MPAFTLYPYGVDPQHLPSDQLWAAIEPLIPERPTRHRGGRPPMPDREAFFAIYYLLATGCQWAALPRSLGARSTVHDRFQLWNQHRLFEELWLLGLLEFNTEVGLDFEWQAIDGCITKAPLGGEATGPNPTDRGKSGTKRHLLTEAHGLPVGLVVTGANRHDKTQVQAVFESMPILAPVPTAEQEQHFCADRGYDFADVRAFVNALGLGDHIKSRGQEQEDLIAVPGYRARRWVCERTHSWMNRFRRLLVRWEKTQSNYLGFIHLACAVIVWRSCPVFG